MRPSVSVCMAAYNGASFIKQQINSIISELRHDDELIILDDCSTDNTREIISEISFPGLRLYVNDKNMGHVKTFAKVLGYAKNQIIFLSDQDDIWVDKRVDMMINALQHSNSSFVLSHYEHFSDQPPSVSLFPDRVAEKCRYYPHLISLLKFMIGESQLPAYGCAMAFKRELLSVILPFPDVVEAHDHWVVLCALAWGPWVLLNDITVLHRIHRQNLSPTQRRSLALVFNTRLNQLRQYFIASNRVRTLQNNAK